MTTALYGSPAGRVAIVTGGSRGAGGATVRRLAARGYAVVLCNSDEDLAKERSYVDILRTRRVDGLILVPSGRRKDYAGFLEGFGAPVLFVDRAIPGLPADTVAVDGADASPVGQEPCLELVDDEEMTCFLERLGWSGDDPPCH